ncbi:MAG TPA: hypothetical protein VJA27_01005 [Patescibacteria group bacterium]|nr:hypothetical protein [Patescibacteria group bacterium]
MSEAYRNRVEELTEILREAVDTIIRRKKFSLDDASDVYFTLAKLEEMGVGLDDLGFNRKDRELLDEIRKDYLAREH